MSGAEYASGDNGHGERESYSLVRVGENTRARRSPLEKNEARLRLVRLCTGSRVWSDETGRSRCDTAGSWQFSENGDFRAEVDLPG